MKLEILQELHLVSAILNSINYIPVFIGLMAFIVLYQGDYKVLERSLVFLVLIMSISFYNCNYY